MILTCEVQKRSHNSFKRKTLCVLLQLIRQHGLSPKLGFAYMETFVPLISIMYIYSLFSTWATVFTLHCLVLLAPLDKKVQNFLSFCQIILGTSTYISSIGLNYQPQHWHLENQQTDLVAFLIHALLQIASMIALPELILVHLYNSQMLSCLKI